MSQPRDTQAPTPERNPDGSPKREASPPPEPLFSTDRSLTPDTASEPSIKNR